MPHHEHRPYAIFRGLAPAFILVWSVALGVAGCAPGATVSAGGPQDGADRMSYGTIVSMRIIERSGVERGQTGRPVSSPDVRGTILVAVGAPEAGTQGGGTVEFIILEDNAMAPISVVQDNAQDFRPGERVALSRGARTRLARSGS